MRISIEHQTIYRYPGEVLHTAQYLHLSPRNNPSQRIEDWRIDAPGQLTPWEDAYGNICHTLVEDRPTTEIVVTARGRVQTTDTAGVLPPDADDPPIGIFLRPTPLTRATPEIRAFAADFRRAAADSQMDGLHALMNGVRDRLEYTAGATHGQSTAAEALAKGAGVCQDFAHLFVACARSLAIPTRYIGGYLYDGQQPMPVTAGHAWAEAWVEKLGWVSFDVANGVYGTENHVGAAVGLDYNDVAPIRGVRVGGVEDERMEVAIWISRSDQ
jgi:transglutaminase-like putative cysteine protease